MRTVRTATTISLVVFIAACGKRQQETVVLSDDLKKDLAAVGGSGDLATAPTHYQPMRFVSAIERSSPGVAGKRPSTSVQHARSSTTHHRTAQPAADVASDPVQATVAESPASSAAQETPATAPTPEPITVAPAPSPEPSPAPASGAGGGGGGVGDAGGGIGAIIGGIMGAVIRGGHVGVDKCDPRTDGRGGGGIIDRGPILGMPTYPGGGPHRRW